MIQEIILKKQKTHAEAWVSRKHRTRLRYGYPRGD